MSDADPSASGTGGMALLLVDDDPAFSQMLRWDLEELGYRLVVAHSCCEARRACRVDRFPLAVLDLDLPDGDGMDLARELAQQDADMKVVICSGRHQRLATMQPPDAILAILTKPVSIERLKRLLSA